MCQSRAQPRRSRVMGFVVLVRSVPRVVGEHDPRPFGAGGPTTWSGRSLGEQERRQPKAPRRKGTRVHRCASAPRISPGSPATGPTNGQKTRGPREAARSRLGELAVDRLPELRISRVDKPGFCIGPGVAVGQGFRKAACLRSPLRGRDVAVGAGWPGSSGRDTWHRGRRNVGSIRCQSTRVCAADAPPGCSWPSRWQSCRGTRGSGCRRALRSSNSGGSCRPPNVQS